MLLIFLLGGALANVIVLCACAARNADHRSQWRGLGVVGAYLDCFPAAG
jgi:hypothetical protein